MGFIDSLERRSSTTLRDPAPWLFNAFGASKTNSGVNVTPSNALEVSAVWSAVRLISGTIASLPFDVFQRTSNGKTEARSHPLYTLLHDTWNPVAGISSFVGRELLAVHLLVWGNAFFEIERNRAGQVIALWPIHPTAVSVTRDEAGRKLFRVRVDGEEIVLRGDSILHVPGMGTDGVAGLIPMLVQREAIGLSKAATEYSARFFSNSSVPPGILRVNAPLRQEQEAKLRKAWETASSGLSNAHRIAVLSGVEFQSMGMSARDSQLIEARKLSVTDVARIFNLPPHLLGDTGAISYASVEQSMLAYVMHCIQPLCRRIESEMNMALMPPGMFCQLDLRGLMRGDNASRAAFYVAMVNNGLMPPNEIRSLEDLPPLPGGDDLRAPLNTAPIGDTENE